MIAVYDVFSTKEDLLYDRTIRYIMRNVISCVRTTALNGTYELEIKAVMDRDLLSHVKPKSIIKSPSGQFYIVYWIQYSSAMSVTLKCKHIFYYLSARMCEEREKLQYNAYYAISSIMFEYEQDPRLIKYDFDFSSDIETLNDINYYGENKAYALLGSSNSVCNIYNGEIYRDNFYFSINKRMQYARENAFVFKDGWNTSDIKVTIDDSNTITVLWGDDNLGNAFGVSRVVDGQFPYHTIRYQKYSYSQKSYLASDSMDFYNTYSDPAISIDVSLVGLRNTSKDSPWLELEKYGVGDSGTVFFESLGFETSQRIMELKFDEIEQRNISVKLGNYRNTILIGNRYDKLIGKDDSSGKRLDAIENRLNS